MHKHTTTATPIYLQVKQHLERLIVQGTLAGGGLVPSDRDLAKQFKTSLVTAQRAVNMLAAEGKVSRLPRKGTVVMPGLAAPKTSGRPVWAVLVPDLEYFYPPIIKAIEGEARKLGVTMVLGCVGGSLEQERQMIFQKIEEGVSGIILAPVQPYGPTPADFTHPVSMPRPAGSLDYLAALPVPLVVIDHFGMDMPNLGVDCVIKDDFAGTYQATAHLIGHGYQKIAAFVGLAPGQPPLPHEFVQRRKGYEAAMADHGLALPELPPLSAYHLDHDTATFKRYLDADYKAYVVGDDGTAALLVRLLDGWGVKVPEDVAVIGYDDDRMCTLINPPLSSVRVPKQEMGCKAVQFLHERITNRMRGNFRSLIFKPEVVARASCGCMSFQVKQAGAVSAALPAEAAHQLVQAV